MVWQDFLLGAGSTFLGYCFGRLDENRKHRKIYIQMKGASNELAGEVVSLARAIGVPEEAVAEVEAQIK